MSLSVDIRVARADFALEVAFESSGGVLALFGRSGAGKSTVVNALAGLVSPQSGRIALGERVLFDSSARIDLAPHKRRIGYVFQDARLFPHMSVAANLRYGRRGGGPGAGAPDEGAIVEMLGIAPLLDRRPAGLSGGEAQRVAIGRALLSGPELLLLDEPLAALDAARRAEILPYLERLRDAVSLPIVFVSHAVEEVVRLAGQVVVLEAGRVIATGGPDAILADPSGALGPGEAGVMLSARVAEHLPADHLTRLDTGAGALWVPLTEAPVGSALRVRLLARDVTLSTVKPEGTSALNILQGTVQSVAIGADGMADVVLECSGHALRARITGLSVRRLGITPGQPVHAMLKSVTLRQERLFA